MTYAPTSILAVRHEFQRYTNLSNVALGIVRNEMDTSYHVGKSYLKPGAYSVNESRRDRNPTEASSAIDIGYFSFTKHGKTHTLRTYSRWLVNECERGAPDTLDIREIIWSPDGKVVRRWDREKKRTSGDKSHTGHTHKSWYRDSENRDRAAVTRRYFREQVEGIYTMAEVTSFTPAAREVMQQEATDGTLGYKGGGLPTWEGAPTGDKRPNFLNTYAKLFGMVAVALDELAEVRAELAEIKAALPPPPE